MHKIKPMLPLEFQSEKGVRIEVGQNKDKSRTLRMLLNRILLKNIKKVYRGNKV